MPMKLYVGGLVYTATDKDLEAMFADLGAVTSVTIIKDRDSGQSKGFGFVEMPDIKEAQNAIKSLNGKEVNGRTLTVSQARPQEDRRPSGGGGSFGRSY